MKQILHIFAKDSRHFRYEILASLVVTFAAAFLYPDKWQSFHGDNLGQRLPAITNGLLLLTILSWWLLIARAVHGESLVGDQEFWLTRPYEWKKLLAAKLLFVAAWICLPYFLSQSLLLAETGFHPLSYLPGLLLVVFAPTALVLLPLLSLAAVTANFARMTLTLLGGIFLVIAMAYLSSTGNGYTTSTPDRDHFIYPLLFCGTLAIAAFQYATRRVWIARALLVVLPVLAVLVYFAGRRQSLVDRTYPQVTSGAATPLQTSFAPTPAHQLQAREWSGYDYIDVPIHFDGVPEGYAIFADNFKFTLTAADGYQWTSPWQVNNDRILPGGRSSGFSLKLTRAIFDRFKSAPVTLRLTLALTRLQTDTILNVPFPSGDAAIDGIGICSPASYGTSVWLGLSCRSAIQKPRLGYITMQWSSGPWPCSDRAPAPETTPLATSWIGVVDPGDEPVGPLSVSSQTLYFSGRRIAGDYSSHLCPGTPLTITQYHVVDRSQADFTFPNFQLPAITVKN